MGIEPRDTPSAPAPPAAKRLARVAAATRRIDTSPGLIEAARTARETILPGDPRHGDELSTAEGRPSQVLARRLAETGHRTPRASRELGLGALQVWQAISESIGRGAGTEHLAIMFTDLVGFSSWALKAGDDLALELLRDVAAVVEPEIRSHGGRVVKRLGDGTMAVFTEAQSALNAGLAAQRSLAGVEVAGHRARMRVGVHYGRPRKLGEDYLGVDVNIAARVTDAAKAGEVLLSGPALAAVDLSALSAKRRRGFRAKGAPRDLDVYAVAPAA
jgi:adenylate cyclase